MANARIQETEVLDAPNFLPAKEARSQAEGEVETSTNSLFGKRPPGSAALSFGAMMEMYHSYSEAMNHWATTMGELTSIQSEFIRTLADETYQVIKRDANVLAFQAGGAASGVLTGAFGIAGSIKARNKTKESTAEFSTASRINASAKDPLNSGVIFREKAPEGQLARVDELKKAAADKVAHKIEKRKASEIYKQIENGKGADVLERPFTVKVGDEKVTLTLKEVLESRDTKTQEQLETVFEKEVRHKREALTGDQQEANAISQQWNSMGQLGGALIQSGLKVGEAIETTEKADHSKAQQFAQGSLELARKSTDATTQSIQANIQGAQETLKGVLGLVQNDAIRG